MAGGFDKWLLLKVIEFVSPLNLPFFALKHLLNIYLRYDKSIIFKSTLIYKKNQHIKFEVLQKKCFINFFFSIKVGGYNFNL